MTHAPTNDVSLIENFLVKTWTEVLRRQAVSIDDHFIDLGGDSIAAAICLNRVRSEFGLELPIEALLLDGLTVRQLAALIDRRQAARQARESRTAEWRADRLDV